MDLPASYKKGDKGKYQLVAKKGRWLNLKGKLKQITKKTLPYMFVELLRKLKEVYRGWINNFRLGSIKLKLKKVE
ncbi:MAG: RNA-directed DNA polymerase [Marivirga sp.]|jgi:RNA-directed DNA polymerase